MPCTGSIGSNPVQAARSTQSQGLKVAVSGPLGDWARPETQQQQQPGTRRFVSACCWFCEDERREDWASEGRTRISHGRRRSLLVLPSRWVAEALSGRARSKTRWAARRDQVQAGRGKLRFCRRFTVCGVQLAVCTLRCAVCGLRRGRKTKRRGSCAETY